MSGYFTIVPTTSIFSKNGSCALMRSSSSCTIFARTMPRVKAITTTPIPSGSQRIEPKEWRQGKDPGIPATAAIANKTTVHSGSIKDAPVYTPASSAQQANKKTRDGVTDIAETLADYERIDNLNCHDIRP